MGYVSTLLVVLGLALAGMCQQQPLDAGHKKTYNVTLDFDNLPTSPTTGVGFHPQTPHDPAVAYKSLFLESFALLNTSSPSFVSSRHPADQGCAHSRPNAIFASRKEGFPWPRITAWDLSQHDSLDRASGGEGAGAKKKTFSVISIWLKLTGTVTGPPERTVPAVSLIMLRVHPNPVFGPTQPILKDGYPGIFRGVPLPVNVGHVSFMTAFWGADMHRGTKVEVRKLWDGSVGAGIDVIEVQGQVLRWQDGSPGGYVIEEWEVCLDDLVVEIEEGEGNNEVEEQEEEGGPKVVGVKADGAEVQEDDWEWGVMREMASL